MSLTAKSYILAGADVSDILRAAPQDYDLADLVEFVDRSDDLDTFYDSYDNLELVGVKVAEVNSLESAYRLIQEERFLKAKQTFTALLAQQGIHGVDPKLYLSSYVSL